MEQWFYTEILRLARSVGLANLSANEVEKTIASNIVKFDDLVKRHYRVPALASMKGRGNRVGEKISKGPEFPRRSPLYLDAEMQLLCDLSRPFWKGIDHIKENYVTDVLSKGWHTLSEEVAAILNRRWEILSRFGRATTKRLQQLKRETGNLSIRKSQVKSEDITKLITSKQTLVENFYNELCQILPINGNEVAIYEELYNVIPESPSALHDKVCHLAFLGYSSIPGMQSIEGSHFAQKLGEMKSLETEYQRVLLHFEGTTKLVGKLRGNSSFLIPRVKASHLDLMIEECATLMRKIENMYHMLDRANKTTVMSVCKVYYHTTDWRDRFFSRVREMTELYATWKIRNQLVTDPSGFPMLRTFGTGGSRRLGVQIRSLDEAIASYQNRVTAST